MNFQVSVARNVYELNADINVKLTSKYTIHKFFFPQQNPPSLYIYRKWIEIDTQDIKNMKIFSTKLGLWKLKVGHEDVNYYTPNLYEKLKC